MIMQKKRSKRCNIEEEIHHCTFFCCSDKMKGSMPAFNADWKAHQQWRHNKNHPTIKKCVFQGFVTALWTPVFVSYLYSFIIILILWDTNKSLNTSTNSLTHIQQHVTDLLQAGWVELCFVDDLYCNLRRNIKKEINESKLSKKHINKMFFIVQKFTFIW